MLCSLKAKLGFQLASVEVQPDAGVTHAESYLVAPESEEMALAKEALHRLLTSSATFRLVVSLPEMASTVRR